MIPRFNVYLFDIDGTLLDSAADICGAIQEVLAAHGSGPLTYDYLKTFIGLHLNACFREVLPHFTPAQFEQLVDQYRAAYHSRCHQGTRVFPGVREGLAALSGRKSTATSKTRPRMTVTICACGRLTWKCSPRSTPWRERE